MSYSIPLSDKSVLTTVQDGTFNNEYSNINLVGKNFVGYGKLMNENFVHLLENFSNIDPPTNPLVGQLWYDSGKKVLKIFTHDHSWLDLAYSQVGISKPVNPKIGDQWWNQKTNQLNIWTGKDWLIIGPYWTYSQGLTGSVAETVLDKGGASHVVMKFYIGKTFVGLWSKDKTFTLADEFIFPGMSATISPGLTFALIGTTKQNIFGAQGVGGGGGTNEYIPTIESNWIGKPTINTVQTALDELSSRLKPLEIHEIDGGNSSSNFETYEVDGGNAFGDVEIEV